MSRSVLGLSLAVWAGIAGAALPAVALAQDQSPAPPWSFRTRALITGSSSESEPSGYQVYSAIAIEVGLTRRLHRSFGAELTLRTESREVDFAPGEGPVERLGSLELLPVSLLFQFRPAMAGKFRPYAGLGVNFTTAWEKSGVLDSMDVKSHLGPAVQAGADINLSATLLFNVDLRWNSLTTEIENGGVPYTSLKIDPIGLGVGLGFRF